MRKRLRISAIVMAMTICMLASPGAVKAAEADSKSVTLDPVSGYFDESGKIKDADGNYLTDKFGDTVDIGVNAITEDSPDIVFAATVQWGSMNFKYSYGSRWDPTQHKYIASSSNVGWDKTSVEDSSDANVCGNNEIKVRNDSNYPIVAEFSYANESETTFNASQGETSVAGGFSLDNTKIKTAYADQTTIPGKGSLQTAAAVAGQIALTGKLVLDMDLVETSLSKGDTVYTLEDTIGGTAKEFKGSMYFALFGKPDTTKAIGGDGSYEQVGTISINFRPANNASDGVTISKFTKS